MYKFRLTLFHSNPGFFNLDCSSFGYEVNQDIGLEVFARDSEELFKATKYHIDCGGFESEELARVAGEELRKKLRLLNSVLDLGLIVHSKDKITGKTSGSFKYLSKEKGATLLDSRVGLSVIPDDGLHLELINDASLNVRISDPIFLLDEVKNIWDFEFEFDGKAEEVIELLNLSSTEPSPKLKFLMTYLALEQLITIKQRSNGAQELITTFIKETQASNISDEEKASLVGSLSNLKKGSFSGAFKTLAKSITNPKEIQGFTPDRLASQAIDLRNKIAHGSETTKDTNIYTITKGVREVVLGLLWSQYKLPALSIDRPADTVSVGEIEMRIL